MDPPRPAASRRGFLAALRQDKWIKALAECGPLDPRALLTERDHTTALVLHAIGLHRREIEMEDLKDLAYWTGRMALTGKAP